MPASSSMDDETGATNACSSFKANPDFESPGDSGRDNVYEVTLVVTDSKGNSDEQDVTVKVTNVEEDGTDDRLLDSAAARRLPGDGHTRPTRTT